MPSITFYDTIKSRSFFNLEIMTHVENILQELGLNQKEVSIYLTLLSTGTAPASVLGHRTDIKRSTARYTCQQLHKKGLVSMVQKGETQLFSYEPPERLKLLLQKKREEIDRKEDQVNQIIGDLKMRINPEAVLPKVQFFEGWKSIEEACKKVLDDLEKKDQIIGFVKTLEEEEGPEKLHKTLNDFVEKRLQKKVFYRVIAAKTPTASQLQKSDAAYHRETRLVSPEQFEVMGSEIIIYKNKVYSMTYEDGIAMATIVESKSLTQMQRGIFWALWNQLDA